MPLPSEEGGLLGAGFFFGMAPVVEMLLVGVEAGLTDSEDFGPKLEEEELELRGDLTFGGGGAMCFTRFWAPFCWGFS